MTPLAHHEPMSAAFHKWHVPAGLVLHRFTAPDGGDWHDHPFDLDIQVIAGGYVEEVLDPASLMVTRNERRPGDCFTITAAHVHRIIHLPDGECWTIARYGPWQRPSGFWRIRDGRAERRRWNEQWEEAA